MSATGPSEETILEQALTFASMEARAAYLRGACGDDQELLTHVESLIKAHEAAGGFLPLKHSPGRQSGDAENHSDERLGTVIGRYKLLQRIGEGGCGVVYMAEQEEPVRRRVALKVIKLGMDTRSVVARFEAERQALAMMDHPNIAKVFDAGATENGRPYFVMELVGGVRITEYCDQHQLTTQQRLDLFVQVCQAVQHAHQKGIIHRDLKPSNILVTLHDGVPVPKVIDFGIAKATEGRLTDKTIYTELHQFIGTPAYMSPEQAQMNSQDIDTRSDIYSLGVLLYELLTGQTPFDAKELLKAGLDEMRRTIREKEPVRPSTRLTQELTAPRGLAYGVPALAGKVLETLEPSGLSNALPAKAGTPYGGRRSLHETQQLIHLLRGDLDWIVMKCLEKDRARRYETANGLAADIQRHLTNEPVVARPPSTAYRFQKFVRRNKLAFAAASAVVFALVAGIAVSSWQAMRATRAEQAQAHERALAEARLQTVLKYVDRVFQDVAPELWELVGAAKASETLTTNTMALLAQLRVAEETNPEFRQVLGQLYLRLAYIQGWPRANSAWDPEAGLQAAREAIRLLQPTESERPSDEHIRQLARAEQQAAAASIVLQAPEEAIGHYREIDRWATLITNSASVGEEARSLKWMAQGGPGWVLLWTRRFEEALTNHFLPRLRQLEARGIPEQSADIFDFGRLSQAHKWTAVACLKLGRKEEALAHRREALRYGEVMTERQPNNSEFAGDRTVLVAELGESFLALYRPEGLVPLKEALDSANSLAARDPGNSGFMLTQIAVLRCFVQGLTAWAGEPSATVNERRDRLAQAQAHLDEADKLLGTLRSDSARKAIRFELEPARTELAAARTKLDPDGGAQPKP